MMIREKYEAILNRNNNNGCGFWIGNPHPDTWLQLKNYFETDSEEEIRLKLNDGYRWIEPADAYNHPEGKPVFDNQRKGAELSAGGVFADCDCLQEIEDFTWPNIDYLNFEKVIHRLRNAGDVYRASGFWAPFFHDVADFLGMENYFIKMYTSPEIVHAITRHVIDFYLRANEKFYYEAGDLIDAYFFGNDFGTQNDLLISRDSLKEFVFPYMKELIDQAKDHGYKVVLHSCGSIYSVIPDLIEMGIDGLHPLQAKAKNMNAEKLAAEFKGSIAFIGGVDTQDLLVNGSLEEIQNDVQRVINQLGPNLIVSPSHEAILPNIPPQNIAAVSEALFSKT
ncbi:MAG: hypothetical protein K9J16_18135 [Melioribacteraceae bacterium]|nr:hypothetical protein [Melioribacteraceae bacterium]MCF8356754.1 hypothetical protein [Melioribacteraceae bacterium]MCF8396141.1 hypothetical protein [Melioribacteraceae bacterium]MCF8421118.1 hypothetical protein [Melioribacteraceae bacterium]